ncbi:MAG TPA: hypothetical protein VE592_11130 [Geminicoccaceae bacterium]|jgi:hypothetical protein|nr:hypothetical protein [Geminicoccaceae bacterium]
MIRNPLVLASAVLVALGAAGALAQNTAPVAEETAKDIVATTVRSQGYSCENPKRAIRDRAASSPDRAAWVVECANATYRVRYDNDLPAEISQID